jgi:hypothetical protein
MRLLLHMLAIVGLLGMMTNVVLQSHAAPQYALHSAPHQQ